MSAGKASTESRGPHSAVEPTTDATCFSANTAPGGVENRARKAEIPDIQAFHIHSRARNEHLGSGLRHRHN